MPDGTGTAYEEVEKINLSNIENSQLNLYAIWENEKGIITFNSNDKNNNIITKLAKIFFILYFPPNFSFFHL